MENAPFIIEFVTVFPLCKSQNGQPEKCDIIWLILFMFQVSLRCCSMVTFEMFYIVFFLRAFPLLPFTTDEESSLHFFFLFVYCICLKP